MRCEPHSEDVLSTNELLIIWNSMLARFLMTCDHLGIAVWRSVGETAFQNQVSGWPHDLEPNHQGSG